MHYIFLRKLLCEVRYIWSIKLKLLLLADTYRAIFASREKSETTAIENLGYVSIEIDVKQITDHLPILAGSSGGYFERTLVRDDGGYLEWFNGQRRVRT